MTRAEATAFADAQRRAGRRVVFTNGVFDILHPGHIRYLRQARALGDVLVVGLNGDASVRRNKGPKRPINSQDERAEILAALEPVDAVVIFDEDTPDQIIKAVQPDVLVKGPTGRRMRSSVETQSRRAADESCASRWSRAFPPPPLSKESRPSLKERFGFPEMNYSSCCLDLL